MKPLKLNLVLFLILGWTVSAVAQDDLKVVDAAQRQDMEGLSKIDKFVATEDRVPVYLNKDFYKATITMDEVKLINCPTKYNVRDQELIVQINGQLWSIEDKAVVKYSWESPKSGNQMFENANNFSLDASFMPGFMQVHNTGSFKMLEHFRTEVQDNYNPTANHTATTLDHIVVTNFYVDQGDKTVFVEKTKKEILGVFGDKSGVMADYMKKNKIKVRRASDLGKAMQHFNTIAPSLLTEEGE